MPLGTRQFFAPWKKDTLVASGRRIQCIAALEKILLYWRWDLVCQAMRSVASTTSNVALEDCDWADWVAVEIMEGELSIPWTEAVRARSRLKTPSREGNR